LTALLAFDLMSTLLTDPFEQAHEASTGLPMARLAAIGMKPLYHSLERGEITEAEYWRRLRALGTEPDSRMFHRVHEAGCRWIPGMRDLVARCAAKHRTVIATNCPEWAESLRRRFLAGIAVEWFPSYRHGVRKPSAEYFTELCAAAGAAPADLVLVDDKARNVDAVRALGGRAIAFRSAAETAAGLAALLGGPRDAPAGSRPGATRSSGTRTGDSGTELP
jgi:HAD superfamily hydrolase (TIGR01509 family)